MHLTKRFNNLLKGTLVDSSICAASINSIIRRGTFNRTLLKTIMSYEGMHTHLTCNHDVLDILDKVVSIFAFLPIPCDNQAFQAKIRSSLCDNSEEMQEDTRTR